LLGGSLANVRRQSLAGGKDIVISDPWLFMNIAITESRDKVRGSLPFGADHLMLSLGVHD
jgi:hypothetical protein